MRPVVAIVGRPNVGKSALFNKLCGARRAIVDDTPGVTRDRIYATCEWLQFKLTLIDTGGIETHTTDPILTQMRAQAEVAIAMADAILFVTDLRSGVTPNDEEVALLLRKSGRPLFLCVNKCDQVGDPPTALYDFYQLGLGDPYPVSALHGHGTGDLLDAVCAGFAPHSEDDASDDALRVAIIGRPNAGKSSLVNFVVGEDRMIVSPVAGTTRDATDTLVEREDGRYCLIDTAGLRRHSKVDERLEQYAVLRAKLAIDRATVCAVLIDGAAGFVEQDTKVAGLAHESGKACVLVVNKWDAVEKDGKTMDAMRKELEGHFAFMRYAPIVFISAKTGLRVDRLFALLRYVDEQNAMRIPTGRLNELLADATMRVQPPTDKGRRLKIYYMTQASTRPPTFVCFVNRKDLFHYSYQRYVENQIRSVFGLEGTPVRLVVRERARDDV